MRRVLGAALVIFAGCAEQPDVGRYYPPPERAQAALEAALASWQRGDPMGAVPGTGNPLIQVVDSKRSANQTLRGFMVLGVAPGDGPREFTVRLHFDDSSEGVRARYVVFGVDPVWVYRREDYELMCLWCAPTPAK
jgi:hypothetical protein